MSVYRSSSHVVILMRVSLPEVDILWRKRSDYTHGKSNRECRVITSNHDDSTILA